MSSIYYIQNGASAGDIREGLNNNADELLSTRRPWVSGYVGSYCTHNGKDYDLVPGGSSTIQPGNPDHWAERVITVESTGESASDFQMMRGSMAKLQALSANTGVDLFIVEGEAITSDGEDINGRYWRTAVGAQYMWVKE